MNCSELFYIFYKYEFFSSNFLREYFLTMEILKFLKVEVGVASFFGMYRRHLGGVGVWLKTPFSTAAPIIHTQTQTNTHTHRHILTQTHTHIQYERDFFVVERARLEPRTSLIKTSDPTTKGLGDEMSW